MAQEGYTTLGKKKDNLCCHGEKLTKKREEGGKKYKLCLVTRTKIPCKERTPRIPPCE